MSRAKQSPNRKRLKKEPFRDQDLLDAVQFAFQRDRDRRVRESTVSQTRARFEALTPREQEVFSLVTMSISSVSFC